MQRQGPARRLGTAAGPGPRAQGRAEPELDPGGAGRCRRAEVLFGLLSEPPACHCAWQLSSVRLMAMMMVQEILPKPRLFAERASGGQ